MRLHLGLGQALGKLNSYDRHTIAGRESAINLAVFPARPHHNSGRSNQESGIKRAIRNWQSTYRERYQRYRQTVTLNGLRRMRNHESLERRIPLRDTKLPCT